jgi:hypothetical protein
VCDTLSTPVRRGQKSGRVVVVEGFSTGVHKFSRVNQPSKNSRRQKGEVKQVPYRRPINFGRHSIKFGRQDLCSRVLV